MCMSIEYHLYLLHFFYHVNDYNLFIIFVFIFMGGSMSAVMLLLCYLPFDHDYYKIIYCIILYVQSHNCISNIFCRSFLYESCVSIKKSFLLLLSSSHTQYTYSFQLYPHKFVDRTPTAGQTVGEVVWSTISMMIGLPLPH